MAMQTAYLKEHEGIVHNSVGQLSSSATSAPWWNGSGSQPVYGDYCAQNKPFSLEFSNYVDPYAAGKQVVRGAEPVIDRGHATQFSIFPGIKLSFGCISTRVASLHDLLLLFIPNCNACELVCILL